MFANIIAAFAAAGSIASASPIAKRDAGVSGPFKLQAVYNDGTPTGPIQTYRIGPVYYGATASPGVSNDAAQVFYSNQTDVSNPRSPGAVFFNFDAGSTIGAVPLAAHFPQLSGQATSQVTFRSGSDPIYSNDPNAATLIGFGDNDFAFGPFGQQNFYICPSIDSNSQQIATSLFWNYTPETAPANCKSVLIQRIAA
ncbi:hypothetical protein PYCC9005_000847 [Savitreella phatthalungensis]